MAIQDNLEIKIKKAKEAGYSDEQIKTYLKSQGVDTSSMAKFAVPGFKDIVDAGKDVAKGVGKELLSESIDTAKLLQKGGQKALDIIDPTKNMAEIEKQTGFESLKGDKAAEIEEQLKADNTGEKVGKVLGFVGSLLYPVGKAEEVANVASKGKKILGAGKEAVVGKFDDVINFAKNIPDDVMEGGVKVKDRIVEVVSKLDDKTKTALQRTPKETFEEFVEIGKKAVTDDRQITPIEHVGQKFIEGAKAVKNRLDKVGQMKSEILSRAKNGQQDVSSLVKQAILKIQKGVSNLGEDDRKYATEIINKLKPYMKDGRLKDVDGLIDDIQDGLYKLADSEKAVQITDRVTGLIRSSVEGLNRTIQTKVGGSYAKANKQYSQMLKILNSVNRGVGKNGERAGSFMKRFFSPSDAGTKRIFDQMQKLTGIDYARDARLAKFVMESLGDRRVESLLEQIPQVSKDITTTLLELGKFVAKKTGINDPIEAARIFIEKGGF